MFFQILADIEMPRNENRFLTAILKRHKYFIYFFSWNMVVISVYTYGVKIIKKFRRESGFLGGGVHGTPVYALTEVRGTFCSFNYDFKQPF